VNKEPALKKPALLFIFLGLLLPTSASWAQILAPNDSGVSMGSWHTLARDVETSKKFWLLLGGTPLKIDGTEVVKFPGVLVFLQPGSPIGGDGNMGCAVDHPGFSMKNGEEFLAKLKNAGVKIDPIEGRGPDSGYISTPDGLRIEMQGNPNDLTKRSLLGFSPKEMDLSIVADHLHYFLPESNVEEAQTWYVKIFGAQPLRENNKGKTPAADLPGIRLRFGASRNATQLAPTKGRSLDHIGFEVKNLEAFCKRLKDSGVKFDEPYSKSRHKSFASAGLTDAWGTSIELTEGLNQF
jgi:catechol 2,3-dioxygenase-like lactoylglutathione lyase family enzyme